MKKAICQYKNICKQFDGECTKDVEDDFPFLFVDDVDCPHIISNTGESLPEIKKAV